MASKYVFPLISFNKDTDEYEKFDANKLVIRSADASKKDPTQFYVNFGIKQVNEKGKEVIVKPRLIAPPRPSRMYSRHNDEYDSTTNKLTMTLNKENEPIEDILLIEVIQEIDDRMKELFTEWVQEQIETNKAFKKIEWDERDTRKKFGDLLFYYTEDKNGNDIENPEKIQKFSVKIETKYFRTVGISFLKRKVKDEDGEVEEQEWPKTVEITDPETKQKKTIKTTGKLKWTDFRDIYTMSSNTIEFDSVFVRIEKGVDLAAYRRVYLVNNAIADFIERGDDGFIAEAAQEIYGSSDKVNPNLAEKLAKLSEYQFGNDDDDSSSSSESNLKASEEESDHKKSKKSKGKAKDSDSESRTKDKPKNKKNDGDSSPTSDGKVEKRSKRKNDEDHSENSAEEEEKVIKPKRKTRTRRSVPADGEMND